MQTRQQMAHHGTRVNYTIESYCRICEAKRPKGLWCKECGNRMANKPRYKSSRRNHHRY